MIFDFLACPKSGSSDLNVILNNCRTSMTKIKKFRVSFAKKNKLILLSIKNMKNKILC